MANAEAVGIMSARDVVRILTASRGVVIFRRWASMAH